MTTFWSWYVTVLTVGTLIALFWLIFATRKSEVHKTPTEQTMGHSFDGIEEYDNPLPNWWFLLFIGTLIFSIGYLVLYPGLGNWKGILPGYSEGWTQDHQWDREMDRADQLYGPIFAKYAAMPLDEVAKDEHALKMGGRMFNTYCSTCHGSDAKGSYGFPNLTDSTWRWGGSADEVKTTIMNGRQGVMPPHEPIIGEDGVRNVAAYVLTQIAGRPLPAGTEADLAAGEQIFATICSACHTAAGTGMHALGSPDLTIPGAWLYGSSFAQIQQTVRHGRNGQMPAQAQTLGNDKIHLLAAYVLSLSSTSNTPAQ